MPAAMRAEVRISALARRVCIGRECSHAQARAASASVRRKAHDPHGFIYRLPDTIGVIDTRTRSRLPGS